MGGLRRRRHGLDVIFKLAIIIERHRRRRHGAGERMPAGRHRRHEDFTAPGKRRQGNPEAAAARAAAQLFKFCQNDAPGKTPGLYQFAEICDPFPLDHQDPRDPDGQARKGLEG